MSNRSWKSLKVVAGLFVLATSSLVMAGTSQAVAQEDECGSQTLSPNVAKPLGEAYELGNADQYAAAISAVDNLLAQRSGSMSPYELATTYEIRASFKSQLDPPNYPGSLADFERALAQNALCDKRQRQIRFFIAQLYYTQERYPEAARFLEEYIAYANSIGENIDANTYYLLAGAYVAQNNFSRARNPMEQALRKLDEPKKAYYDLMNYIYSEVGADSQRGDLLVTMIGYWPEDGNYWGQLAGAYSQAGRDADAATVLELAYKAGIITDAPKILSLIQYYSVLDNPIRGAVLLEKEMAAGNIERSQKNLELLAQLYNLAREQKKALVPLRQAAEISPDGELFYRLGQVYFADEQWREAERALTQAINRGGLNNRQTGDAWLLIGNARYYVDTNSRAQRRRAIEAYRRASNYSTSRTAARGWIDYINAVTNTEDRQCNVEILQAVERYNNAISRCETIIDVFRRVGPTPNITQESVDECNQFTASTINEETATISFDDGTTEAGPACRASAPVSQPDDEGDDDGAGDE